MNNTILKKIILDKNEWIKYYKKKTPLKNLKYNILPTKRSFYNSISNSNTSFILECKKASPSKGIIRPNFDPVSIAKVYKNYASVISVLTDEKYFKGSFKFLSKVSKIVNQPVLCKDFIIDEWQIYLARFYKADAILLMLSVLDDESYNYLSYVAHSLNMGVLTEVVSEKECVRAIKLNAKVVGINNRNLHDLSIDLNRTRKFSKFFSTKVKLISESGINKYSEIRDLSRYVNGFLIGSSLMKEENLNISIKRILIGENKVCGLKRKSDACAALEYGAIYGGIIFIKESPRFLEISKARILINGANLIYVGVFRNSPINEVVVTVVALSLSVVQLHGNENQIYIDKLRLLLPYNCLIWKAFNIIKNIPKKLDNVDKYVFDNGGGGSGKQFNWSILNGEKLDNVILAGGLSIENCIVASRIGCSGLDFNSGIEKYPGIKDNNKLSKVFYMLRDY